MSIYMYLFFKSFVYMLKLIKIEKMRFALLLSCFLFNNSIFSQIEKNNWMLGGSLSINATQSQNEIAGSYSTIKLSPSVGYFFEKNFAAGVLLEYQTQGSENLKFDFGNSIRGRLSVGPFARYYFLESVQKNNFFLEMFCNYTNNIRFSDKPIFRYGTSIGYVHFINQSIGIETKLVYQRMRIPLTDGASKLNSFTLMFGFQIHLERE